jgi:hypothetical protein
MLAAMTQTPSLPQPSSEEICRGFAEELAKHYPEIWRKLLVEHVADSSGRCRACRYASRAAACWPCNLWGIADQARQLQVRRS